MLKLLKYISTLLFGLISLNQFIWAGSNNNEIDSLLNLHNKTDLDSIKVNLLLEIAVAYQGAGDTNAGVYYLKAVNKADSIGYYPGLVKTRFALANYYFGKREFLLAIEFFEQTLRLVNSGEADTLKGKVFLSLGKAMKN